MFYLILCFVLNGKITTSFHCSISLWCFAPFCFRKPQRGDEILKHLTKGQCFMVFVVRSNPSRLLRLMVIMESFGID